MTTRTKTKTTNNTILGKRGINELEGTSTTIGTQHKRRKIADDNHNHKANHNHNHKANHNHNHKDNLTHNDSNSNAEIAQQKEMKQLRFSFLFLLP